MIWTAVHTNSKHEMRGRNWTDNIPDIYPGKNVPGHHFGPFCSRRRKPQHSFPIVWAMQGRRSQANGALMRIAPLAIYGHRLPLEKLADLAQQDARLSHRNPICQVSFLACLTNTSYGHLRFQNLPLPPLLSCPLAQQEADEHRDGIHSF